MILPASENVKNQEKNYEKPNPPCMFKSDVVHFITSKWLDRDKKNHQPGKTLTIKAKTIRNWTHQFKNLPHHSCLKIVTHFIASKELDSDDRPHQPGRTLKIKQKMMRNQTHQSERRPQRCSPRWQTHPSSWRRQRWWRPGPSPPYGCTSRQGSYGSPRSCCCWRWHSWWGNEHIPHASCTGSPGGKECTWWYGWWNTNHNLQYPTLTIHKVTRIQLSSYSLVPYLIILHQ